MRIMALDYGSVTVGVALTDELGMTAQPYETITREKANHLRKTLSRILETVRDKSVNLIVLGKPVHMDGSPGERVEQAEAFGRMLSERLAREGLNADIVWQDERLTTAEADEILDEMGVKKEDRKKYIDKIAAAVILRDYMNQHELT